MIREWSAFPSRGKVERIFNLYLLNPPDLIDRFEIFRKPEDV